MKYLSKITSVITATVITSAVIIGGFVTIPYTAEAADTTPALTIDASGQNEKIGHFATGFLYGVSDEGSPSVNTLTSIKPKVLSTKGALGTEHPYGDALDIADEFFEAGGEMVMMYANGYYGKFGTNVEASEYAAVLKNEICPAVVEYKNSVKDKYPNIDSELVYIPINEGTPRVFNGETQDTIFEVWKMYYDAIREVDENAAIAGPNNATYFSGYATMEAFLTYCKENNCLPDVITWHQLGDSGINNGIVNNSADYRSICQKLGIDEKPVVVNEYAWYTDCGVPGKLVNWIAKFEEAGVYGCLPFWHQANNLNDLTAGQNEGASAWWAYKWYADMEGNRLDVSQENTTLPGFYGLASLDEAKHSLSILAGGNDGDGKIVINNLNQTETFKDSANVHVKVRAAYYKGINGAVYEPETVLEGVYEASDGSVVIEIPYMLYSAAYNVIITETSENASEPFYGAWHKAYEAEEAGHSDSIVTENQNDMTPLYYFSGGKRVGSFSEKSDYLQYVIDVPLDGKYKLEFVYSNGVGSMLGNMYTHAPKNLSQKLIIDGTREESILLPNTLAFTSSSCAEKYATLTRGRHTIKLTDDGQADEYYPSLSVTPAIYHDVMYVSYVGNENADIKTNIRYEAEEADFNNENTSMKNTVSGYTGSGYVRLNAFSVPDGGGVRITANVPKSGMYNLTLRYLSEDVGYVTLYKDNTNLTLDNSVASAAIASTGGEWSTTSAAVYLSKGINIIDADSSCNIALDYMRVSEYNADKSITVNAADGEGNFETAHSYYADSDYVAEIAAESDETVRDNDKKYLEIKVNVPEAGRYDMTVSHSNNDLGGLHTISYKILDRYAVVEVNGGEGKRYFFPNTYSDDSFEEYNIPVELSEGENTIKFYNDDSWKQNYTLNGNEYKNKPADIPLENYTPNFEKFVFTPSAAESDSGADEYRVNIMNAGDGYVTSDKSIAKKMDSVTLTINPESGAELISLKINGSDVSVTSDTYTVTEIGGDVNVKAEFSKSGKAEINLSDYTKIDCAAFGDIDSLQSLYNPPSNAVDDSKTTYYDAAAGKTLGLNFPTDVYIKGFQLTVAEGNLDVLDGAVIKASSDGEAWSDIYTFSGGIVPYPSVNEITLNDLPTDVSAMLESNSYKWLRIDFVNGTKISDLSVYGTCSGVETEAELTGKSVFGGKYWGEGSDEALDYNKAFDGDTGTYFSGKVGGYCGIDLGRETPLMKVAYYPVNDKRINNLVGGAFYGSNDNVNWQKLCTITENPTPDKWNEIEAKGSYRYIKVQNDTSKTVFNIAELKIYALDTSNFSYDITENEFGVNITTTPYSKVTINGTPYYSGASGKVKATVSVCGTDEYPVKYEISKGGYVTVSGEETVSAGETLELDKELELKKGIFYSEDFNAVSSCAFTKTAAAGETLSDLFDIYAKYDKFDVTADNIKLAIKQTNGSWRGLMYPIPVNLLDKEISMDVRFPDDTDCELLIRDSSKKALGAIYHTADGVTSFGALCGNSDKYNGVIGAQEYAMGDVQGGALVHIKLRTDVTNGKITVTIGDVTQEVDVNPDSFATGGNGSLFTVMGKGNALIIDNILVTSLNYDSESESEYLDVLGGFEDMLTVEKTADKDGVRLVVAPKKNQKLPALKLYRAVYNEDGVLIGVTAPECISGEDDKLTVSLSELKCGDGESYKFMLWGDNQSPVICVINSGSGFFE